MPASPLVPVSVLDDALAKTHAAARAVLSLVCETLHHQFPTGTYLVLTRPTGGDDEDVSLDSVRDAQGNILLDLSEWWREAVRLPSPPAHITALWGDNDPCLPGTVLELIQCIDQVSSEFLDLLPEALCTAEETWAESRGGRTPLGLPLRTAGCPVHGALCEPADHVEPPTVHGEAI